MNQRVARRALLQALAAGPILSARSAFGQQPAGMILREKEPENLESPTSSLQTFITPTEQFYVRNHFKLPLLTSTTWKLKIEGAVDRPFELSYTDFLNLPSRTLTSMLECAGNGRVFLVPKENGAQWALGGAGNAEWTGVPLSAVLEKAGLKPNAVDVMFEGADQGEIRDDPKSPGEIHFARSLPLAKARGGDVLLAFRMNGADLSAKHGAPVRVIVPGWYGMASVKWLSRIVVTDQPYQGFFQTLQYSYWERPSGSPTLVPLTGIRVKAEITRPLLGAVIPKGTSYQVQGLAWAGEANVRSVEVSADSGQTWNSARLTGSPVRYAWRMFEYEWKTPSTAGPCTLMARATDDRGQTQPMQRNRDYRSYQITHVLPIETQIE